MAEQRSDRTHNVSWQHLHKKKRNCLLMFRFSGDSFASFPGGWRSFGVFLLLIVVPVPKVVEEFSAVSQSVPWNRSDVRKCLFLVTSHVPTWKTSVASASWCWFVRRTVANDSLDDGLLDLLLTHHLDGFPLMILPQRIFVHLVQSLLHWFLVVPSLKHVLELVLGVGLLHINTDIIQTILGLLLCIATVILQRILGLSHHLFRLVLISVLL